MRILLLLLAVVLACAVLYAVRNAQARIDADPSAPLRTGPSTELRTGIEIVTVIDDPAAGTTTLSTRDFNLLVHYYNLMLEERSKPRRGAGCI